MRQGIVYGDSQAVSGAAIQLYAVGPGRDRAAATPLLSPAGTTDSSGGFTLFGSFTCPSAGTLFYVVATGGSSQPGSAPNQNLAMMATLGLCGNLSSNTKTVVNERTTVAAVYALAPHLGSVSMVGSSSGDAAL